MCFGYVCGICLGAVCGLIVVLVPAFTVAAVLWPFSSQYSGYLWEVVEVFVVAVYLVYRVSFHGLVG